MKNPIKAINEIIGKFYRDQRLSWIGHALVCVSVSTVLGSITGIWGWFEPGYSLGGTIMLGFYAHREIEDEKDHRDKKKDWDKLDHDRNWKGKLRRMVTPRADKVGDLLGAYVNEVAGLVHLVNWLVRL